MGQKSPPPRLATVFAFFFLGFRALRRTRFVLKVNLVEKRILKGCLFNLNLVEGLYKTSDCEINVNLVDLTVNILILQKYNLIITFPKSPC